MELAGGFNVKHPGCSPGKSVRLRICHWISRAAVGAVACSVMSTADSAADEIFYASASPTVFDGSTTTQLDLMRARSKALQDRSCKHLTLVLSGIRAAKVDATGARLELGGTPIGSFSFYGFETGAPRTLSFLLPPAAASFSPSPATLELKVQLLDHQSGSLAVDSIRIVCLKA